MEANVHEQRTTTARILGMLGRVLVCIVLLAATFGYTDIPSIARATALKVSQNVGLMGLIPLLAAGILSVVLGYKARLGALALLVFLVLAIVYGLSNGFSFLSTDFFGLSIFNRLR